MSCNPSPVWESRRVNENYVKDLSMLRFGRVDDGTMEFKALRGISVSHLQLEAVYFPRPASCCLRIKTNSAGLRGAKPTMMLTTPESMSS